MSFLFGKSKVSSFQQPPAPKPPVTPPAPPKEEELKEEEKRKLTKGRKGRETILHSPR